MFSRDRLKAKAHSVALLIVFLVLSGCRGVVYGRENKPQEPPLKKIAPGVFEIGGVRILMNKGAVEFPAVLNMDQGLLEYLVVEETGKVHESLLSTKVAPYNLQVALLMLGLEGAKESNIKNRYRWKPEGDPVTIRVRWKSKKNGHMETAPIEHWILNMRNRKPMALVKWVFTGSMIYKGTFMAQVEKSMIAVFHDPVALINNPLPDGASDEIWYVNREEVPPPGSEVVVIIRRYIQ